ncbi:MAG: hypothetical protein P1U39_03605 [Legionellaceae bacterium]|nr:hypothetical protein [Legionellaceae bacterium]
MSLEVLLQNTKSFEKQLSWLQHSFDEASKIGLKAKYSLKEYDSFENLCSRYARTIDFLIRKVFRSLDDVEFETQGTLVDVVNRAHKRGLFDCIEDIRYIKDLRNEISHEYMDDALQRLFEDILKWTPIVLDIADNTLRYIHTYIIKSDT